MIVLLDTIREFTQTYRRKQAAPLYAFGIPRPIAWRWWRSTLILVVSSLASDSCYLICVLHTPTNRAYMQSRCGDLIVASGLTAADTVLRIVFAMAGREPASVYLASRLQV